jgi:hypothetical protein
VRLFRLPDELAALRRRQALFDFSKEAVVLAQNVGRALGQELPDGFSFVTCDPEELGFLFGAQVDLRSLERRNFGMGCQA